MGCDYSCSTCRLMFTIGWDHYHSFDRGYGAMTQLVCRRCGNQHYVEHAIDSKTPDRLLGTREPQRWPAERSDKPTSWQLPRADWVEPVIDFELRPARTPVSSPRLVGLEDTLELSKATCVFCDAVGALSRTWPDGDRCPSCSEPTLKRTAMWMT